MLCQAGDNNGSYLTLSEQIKLFYDPILSKMDRDNRENNGDYSDVIAYIIASSRNSIQK
jgi:hypothetical protein